MTSSHNILVYSIPKIKDSKSKKKLMRLENQEIFIMKKNVLSKYCKTVTVSKQSKTRWSKKHNKLKIPIGIL